MNSGNSLRSEECTYVLWIPDDLLSLLNTEFLRTLKAGSSLDFSLSSSSICRDDLDPMGRFFRLVVSYDCTSSKVVREERVLCGFSYSPDV